MTYVIAAACVDVTDRACVEECPVDCIYVGDRMAYVNPAECIDCGACEPVCPVEAIVPERDVPEAEKDFIGANTDFFSEILPGRTEPIGNPGGSGEVGVIGTDVPFVQAYRPS
jgi:NAD-dependent dihydropyrimidine dehydrogenase PreA subunit